MFQLESWELKCNQIRPNSEKEQLLLNAFVWKFSYVSYGIIDDFPVQGVDLFQNDRNALSAVYFILYGDYIMAKDGVDEEAYNHYSNAEKIGEVIQSSLISCEALKRMARFLNNRQHNKLDLYKKIASYKSLAYDSFERDYSELLAIRARSAFEQMPFIYELLEGKQQAELNGNKLIVAHYDKLLGVKYEYYSDYLERESISKNNYKKSITHYNSAILFYKKHLSFAWARKSLMGIYLDKGINYHFQKVLDSAAFYLRLAKDGIKNDNDYHLGLYYHWYADNLKKQGRVDSAYLYRTDEAKFLRDYYKDKIDMSIADLETKYQTVEKEKQILIEQQKALANRNWLIAAVLALLLGSGIAILLQKNTTKKRQLAEQEALLKQQRVDNLLKEQELVSIDAMIAGQEKERQQVANELHDDLGSLMATIKLHFDNVKVSKKDPALKNAQKLLEKAYQKVRGIAHSKNSGVMSDQGLLPAIQRMARTISETNALEVTVADFGMGERMENSLELTLFRMIQELVANAIKHAEATAVDIHLTQHEDNLNIIVADNGKGFEHAQRNDNDTGMGLTNVEKRIEHLEGTFTIDSVLGKGTSILIDIPV
ncbi:MAG: sensor histidine kinase [Bacteroidota bacterium]